MRSQGRLHFEEGLVRMGQAAASMWVVVLAKIRKGCAAIGLAVAWAKWPW